MASSTHRTRQAPPRGRSWTVIAMVIAALWWSSASTAEQTVTRVSVEADGALDAAALLRVLGLAQGSSLDRQQIREAILALYAGGEVEWIRVESEPFEGGLAVTVRISARSKISKARVFSIRYP